MYKDIFKNYKLIPREEYKKCSLSENEKTILCEEGLPDISEDILPWLTFNRNCPIFLNNNVQRRFNYKFIVIAYSYELPICIGENNEIISIDLWFKEPIQYVNKNLESFLEYISVYLTYHNKLEAVFDFDDSHEKERIGIVTEMRKKLSNIDKSALDNVGNFGTIGRWIIMSANNREGYIAVWIGKFNSQKEFQSYITREHRYDKTFDSQFEKDFGLKYYDRDLVHNGMHYFL